MEKEEEKVEEKFEETEDEEYLEGEGGSKYNDALAQLERIGNLWNLCHMNRSEGKLQSWSMNLDCVWMELVADSNKDDEKEYVKLTNSFIVNYKGKPQEVILRHGQKKPVVVNTFGKSFNCLMQKEKFLRKLQAGQGKGSVSKDDDDGL